MCLGSSRTNDSLSDREQHKWEDDEELGFLMERIINGIEKRLNFENRTLHVRKYEDRCSRFDCV